MSTVFEGLIDRLRRASDYNKHDQTAPAVVLWPDKERQWERLLPRLRDQLPILQLGPYNPTQRTGPAIWLRCMVARALPEVDWPEGAVPILYLPGVSKQELRAVAECPRELQPLSELQYRGVLFTQRNGRDWTISAFLQSADGGLQVPVSPDSATRGALNRALLKLADESVKSVQADGPLNAPRLDALLNPEPVRDVLLWLNDPAGRKAAYESPEWDSFRAVCREKFGFDPDKDGEVTAAGYLGKREGMWSAAWARLAEAPAKYTALPELLRKARPTNSSDLFYQPSSWPQDNEEREASLRKALLDLAHLSPAAARETVAQLEQEHGERRGWVWADLGHAPLARVLPHLIVLAESGGKPIGGATPAAVAEEYTAHGWQADRAALEALAIPTNHEDVAAIRAAVDGLYRPLLTQAAEVFQQAVAKHPLPLAHKPEELPTAKPGTCILFADGLRYDIAAVLAENLRTRGLLPALTWSFSALPGVTPTAKPAVSPVAPALGPSTEFGTIVRSDNAKTTAEVLRRELDKAGYQVLLGSETGKPSGSGWTECGQLDSYGHNQGWRLALRMQEQVREIAERVCALLDAGWTEVRIVTDHGWLLLPSALPKVDLPEHLTEARKGRCARLKHASQVTHQTVSWHWDSHVVIAVAPGIGCYVAGKEYEHGGLSPQECVVPILTVTAPGKAACQTTIEELQWNGLRCRMKVSGATESLTVDLRTKAADPSSSIAQEPRTVDSQGKVALVVPDDDKAGNAAIAVLLDANSTIVAQQFTTVGGNGEEG